MLKQTSWEASSSNSGGKPPSSLDCEVRTLTHLLPCHMALSSFQL